MGHTRARARTVHLQSPLTILYCFSAHVQQLKPVKRRKSPDALPYRTARLVILNQDSVAKKSLLRRMQSDISHVPVYSDTLRTNSLYYVCFFDKELNITVRAKPATVTTLGLIDGANWSGVDTAMERSRSPSSREWSGGEASADTCQVESFLIVVKTQSCSKADT